MNSTWSNRPAAPGVSGAFGSRGVNNIQIGQGFLPQHPARDAAARYSRSGSNSSASSSGRNIRGIDSTYASGLLSKLVTGSRGIDMEVFGPSPQDCKRLTARLRQATSWLELRDLLPKATTPTTASATSSDASWVGVDTICLTAAFSALSHAAARSFKGGPSPQQQQQQLHHTSTGGGGSTAATGYSSSMRAAAADADQRAEMAEAASVLLTLSRPRLAEFDAQGLVTVAVSVAKMQAACLAEGWLCAVVPYAPAPATVAVTGSSSTPLSPGSSSSSPGRHALTSLYSELLHHSGFVLHRFTPQALANLIWALATVGHQPCGKWLTEYYRRLDDQLPALKSQDVANILWSLCKLDLMPDIWLRDGLVERALDAVRDPNTGGTSTASLSSTTVGSIAGAGGTVPVSSTASSGTGQDPATLIQCLARWYYLYNYRVPDEWLAEYLAIVQPSLGGYLPFDLVSILHSCVVMNFQPGRSWMADYYAHIMHSLKHDPSLSYGDFQRLMWALSRVDTPPSRRWQREFVAASIPKLGHLKIRALSEFVWALACWDCRPSPTWLAAYFTASHPRLCEARPAHISCQLSALAKLGLTAPGPWLDEALGSFCAQLPEAKAHDLVTLLYSITTVCDDRAWLLGHTSTIKQLADTAASKFAVYDAVMHTKLCVALAAANVCPAADWLTRQQAALVSCLRGGEPVGQAVAQDLRDVYRTWDVEVEGSELAPFLR